VRTLIYLTITRPNISYIVAIVSQFMQNSHIDHYNIAFSILRYIKKIVGHGLLHEDTPHYRLL